MDMIRVGISIATAGVILAAGGTILSLAPTDAGAHTVTGTTRTLSACTAGTWVQQSANVTPAMVNGALTAVTVVSATDAWAVGEYNTGSTSGSLWENWNGAAWSVVGNGGPGVVLHAVTNAGANDVIGVGELVGTTSAQAFIAQWNGSSITRVTLPEQGIWSDLIAVSASSPSNIWAVGTYEDPHNNYRALVYHYNGTSWAVAVPPVHASRGHAVAVLALSPTDVYVTAYVGAGVTLYQWNGSAWTVPNANIYGPVHSMYGPLAGTSDNDLYGLQYPLTNHYSLAEHWNGSMWLKVGARVSDDYPIDIAEGPAGTVWSAGSEGPTQYQYTGVVVEENAAVSLSVTVANEILDGVAAGSGLVFAVGGDSAINSGGAPTGEPLVYMGCSEHCARSLSLPMSYPATPNCRIVKAMGQFEVEVASGQRLEGGDCSTINGRSWACRLTPPDGQCHLWAAATDSGSDEVMAAPSLTFPSSRRKEILSELRSSVSHRDRRTDRAARLTHVET